MAVDFDALVLAPLVNQVFGEPVTWQPAAGAAVSASGIFDANFQEVKWTPNEQEVIAFRPRLGCRVADLGGEPAEGDTFLIRGASYRVSEPPLADGIGHIAIFLHGPI